MINIFNYCWGLFILTISNVSLFFSKNLAGHYKQITNKIDTAIRLNYDVDKRLAFGIILMEDKRFYFHNGADLYAICRALNNFFSANRLEGASTIEQQLVRLITNKREITISRKIKEMVYAVKISNMYKKDEIISTYLNIYQFNNDIKGILKFCYSEKYNFNNLDFKSICEITARIKYPSISKRNYPSYLKRVRKTEILLTLTRREYHSYVNSLISLFLLIL